MDLVTNATFRILKDTNSNTTCKAGIYRIILDSIPLGKTVTVYISPEEEIDYSNRGGRPLKPIDQLKSPRKKPQEKFVGELIWMDRTELQQLSDAGQLIPFSIERVSHIQLSERCIQDYERRVAAMKPFLDIQHLHESILKNAGLGGLIEEVVSSAQVSRSFVYKQWSTLCKRGLDERSLITQRYLCGAPGIKRPVDIKNDGNCRKKAGRKTTKQRIALKFGITLAPEQPGMTADWAAKIRAADRRIPTPKPPWPRRYHLILNSAFCGKAKEENGKIVIVKPDINTYPNDAQIKRVLTDELTRLERLMERTTKRHFKAALRGLVGKVREGVAGPGHTYQIDSTVGDIYLRSSINRAWIVGRPIVYIIVDVWSTAVVGFYVCLTGPSWNMAKISLFNVAADPTLVADLWGYQPILSLNPRPTLCYSLLCDRGEYLSKGHRETLPNLVPMTSYTPPYRGDLKGLAEVLHRIEKDEQFEFVPGAMDHRRAELERRKVNPEDCVFTVREYVQYLYEICSEYNLTADRTHLLDAGARADGAFPSPAGLWHWGHAVGCGYRNFVSEADLVTKLLPAQTARVARTSIRFANCDYSSQEVVDAQWTATARNLGGWDIPVNYYPGSMSTLWTPNPVNAGLIRLHMSDQSKASSELTFDEWSDNQEYEKMQRPSEKHQRMTSSLGTLERTKALRDHAIRETAKANAASSGAKPTFTEARTMELAIQHPSRSETKVSEEIREETTDQYQSFLDELLSAANQEVDHD